MGRIVVSQDLSDAWTRAIREGKIINEFETSGGEKIQFGLRLQNGNNVEYFARNVKTGCEISAVTEEKRIGRSDFIIQFNGYRALKPGSKILNIGRQPDISEEATDCRFYCKDPSHNLSILGREPLVQVALPNWKWNAYYNVVPFEKEGHFLWLPVLTDGTVTKVQHIPQKLSYDFIEDILVLFRNSKNLIFFFNSLHAGASVNHIHIQSVFHKTRLKIESQPLFPEKKGGYSVLAVHPAYGIVFEKTLGLDWDANSIWSCVDFLQNEKVPFNLALIGERICLFPRNVKREVVEEFPTGILASLEFCGKIITADKSVYDSISYDTIWSAFRKTTAKVF